VRANLPPPPPKPPAPSYSYGLKAETGDLIDSQFPDKIKTPVDFGRAIRDAAKTGSPTEGAKLSERMLRKMIDDFESKRSKYRPDGACFNAVIHAYAEMGDAHAAEHILTLMHQEFEKGNAHAEPNAKIYTNILHAWRKSKSADAPERCEKILGTMNRLSDTGALPNCKPDAFSYTVAFHCWAESNRHEAAERADRLFRDMESRYMAGESGLQPDAILYSNVINIFTKNTATHNRAEELLWGMVHDFLTGNKFAEPKIRNFNTIMAMWSKSTEDIAPYKAQTIVLRMLEFCKENILNIAPDSYTYCLLLKTW
jgi:pentatricopeptide repeat protein